MALCKKIAGNLYSFDINSKHIKKIQYSTFIYIINKIHIAKLNLNQINQNNKNLI